MAIIFDSERRRSTHVESGLAVQWVRDDPPMERSKRYKLIVDGAEIPFDASYDYGEEKVKQQYPDADLFELNRRMNALQEINYHASNIPGRFDPQVFVQVWRDLVSQGLSAFRISASVRSTC